MGNSRMVKELRVGILLKVSGNPSEPAGWLRRDLLAIVIISLLLTTPTYAGAPRNRPGSESPAKRPVTVADAIKMTRLGDRLYFLRDSVAQYSPNGKWFVVVLRNGNLSQNTNEYSLLLWHTENIFAGGKPSVLLTRSSSSNRAAIEDVTWLGDNETVAFLGETPGQLRQLYTLNVRTRTLTQLTQSSGNVVSYGITPTGNAFAYVSEEQLRPMFDEVANREGLVVSSQSLRDLIADEKGGDTWSNSNELFVQTGNDRPRRINLTDMLDIWAGLLDRPLLSPDGKWVLVKTVIAGKDLPDKWSQYSDPLLQHFISQGRLMQNDYSIVDRYVLVDSATGEASPLIDAPLSPHGAEAVWSPDSGSVAVGGTYLPLDDKDRPQHSMKRSTVFVAEVAVPTRKEIVVSSEDFKVLRWDVVTNCLVLAKGRENLGSNPPQVQFCKYRDEWIQDDKPVSARDRPAIRVTEGINEPPTLVADDALSKRHTILLDLNPQFRDLAFGKVEEIKWDGFENKQVKGGLYYPPDYIPGKRYPLVIQTHGFIPDKFWIDGPWTTAFAAQPLAGNGIMVLQADESLDDLDSPREIQRETTNLGLAIDFLADKGLIDRTRVGLIGHSRTCLYVMYMLTHSTYPIAAASITDGIDGGYFQYMVFANTDANAAAAIEGLNGGAPFKGALHTWLERAPTFNADKVQTPLRIVAPNGSALLCEWEWFAALTRLGKPVELIAIKDGSHILEKPWDRVISQQGNVDWFVFWLTGREDPDPSKAKQYQRWRSLSKEALVAKSLTSSH